MREEKVHLAIASDEHGMASGLVTLEDLPEEFSTSTPDITLL
jgi:CBS domain containing-hemolysin-like protein